MAQETQKMQVRSLGREDRLEEGMAPTPVFLPRESHGQRRLAGCSPYGHKEPDMTNVTEHTHTIRFHSNMVMVVTGLCMVAVKSIILYK